MKKLMFVVGVCSFGVEAFAQQVVKVAKQSPDVEKSQKKGRNSDDSVEKIEQKIYRAQRANFKASKEVDNFEDSLRAAFANNQEWFANKTEKEVARLHYRQSRMNFLPSLTGTVSTTRTSDRGKNRMPPLENSGKNYTTLHTYELVLKQNIFSGWQTMNSMKMNGNQDRAAFHSLKAKGARLIVEVLDAYSEVWRCRQVLSARIKMELNLKQIFESQRTKLESGICTPAEVASAEANYQTAVYRRIEAETELLSAESKFERITGVKLAKQIHLPDLHIEIPKTFERFVDISMKENHNILETRYLERASLDALNVARGRLAPSVDALVKYGRNMSYVTEGSRPGGAQQQDTYANDRILGSLEVTLRPFADSGNDYSEISIAEQNAYKAQFTAKNTVLAVKEQCVTNWNTYMSTDAMIDASRTSLGSAQLSSESYQEESELGMKSNTEVWDQENRLQEAKINLAEARKKRLVAAINISFLMGRLELHTLVFNKNAARLNAVKETLKTKRTVRKSSVVSSTVASGKGTSTSIGKAITTKQDIKAIRSTKQRG